MQNLPISYFLQVLDYLIFVYYELNTKVDPFLTSASVNNHLAFDCLLGQIQAVHLILLFVEG